MPTVATVRMRYSSQEYWFDPKQTGAQAGDHVIVETARGQEVGLCTMGQVDVDEADVVKPLKPIVRVASEEDLARVDELARKGAQAMKTFRSLVEKHKLDMKPVDVDFMFDGAHATFYFTADERVDFRSLVRDLASEFHVRVDMRQIGVRDEARMFGGLGHCGEELCCARLGGQFQPVGIRMAKEQDLPLNPSKISGLCGRLMCCLRYEYDAYKDFKARAPKKGALIDTPLGMAKVVEFDTPRETVRVRFEDGKSVMLPVSALDTGGKVAKNGENIRPCHITKEKFDQVIEELHKDQTLAMMGEKLFSNDPDLSDKTAEAGSISRNPRRRRRRTAGESKTATPTPRRRGTHDAAEQHPVRDQRKRRRSVAVDETRDGAAAPAKETAAAPGQPEQPAKKRSSGSRNRHRQASAKGKQRKPAQAGAAAKKQAGSAAARPHPGQHSSTVSGDAAQARHEGGPSSHGRNHRRRRHRSGGAKKAEGTQTGQTKPGE